MARVYKDRVAFNTPTTGTGSISVGTVLSAGFILPADGGGIATGDKVYLLIQDGDNFEISDCTFTDASPDTFSRDTVLISKIAGVVGTTKITLSGSAVCRMVLPAFAANRIGDNLGSAAAPFTTVFLTDLGAVSFNNGQAAIWASGGNVFVDLVSQFNVRSSGGSPYLDLERLDAHGSNQTLGILRFLGKDSGNAADLFAQIYAHATDATAGSEDGLINFDVVINGALLTRMQINAGLQIGAPTGGDKGHGTINVATEFYKKGEPMYGKGGTLNDVFRINGQTLNVNTTIAATENAMAVGTITIADGVTLTIDTGGNLAIV
jgi:hypothetical protein